MLRGGAFTLLTVFSWALSAGLTPAFGQLLPIGPYNPSKSTGMEELEEVPAIPSRLSGSISPSRKTLQAPKKFTDTLPVPSYAEAGEGVTDLRDGVVELITERYQNGKVRIQRYVRQDAQRNYLNHGTWTAYSPQGKLLAQGDYQDGKRHGKWMREMSNLGVEAGFQGPFTSQADFVDGQLNGTWTVFDTAQRLVASWDFKSGQLDGKTAAWYPNGQQKSEMNFVQGQPDGEALLYNSQGRVIRKDYYRDGKQLVPVVSRYDNKQKETEGWLLRSDFVFQSRFDWWNGVAEIYRETSSGEDQKIGKWVQWYRNGQLKYVGHFEQGEAVGKHAWWHENGQRQLVGEYETGLREGLWTRWHVNGQRHEEGEYLAGSKFGEWTVWNDQGQVAASQSMTHAEQNVGVPRKTEKRQVSYPRVGQ